MPNILTVLANPIITNEGMQDIFDVLSGAVPIWDATIPLAGLYSNDIALTPGTVLGDLVPCVFSGYAQVAMANFLSAMNPDDIPELLNTTLAEFTGDNPLTVPDTVAGWYLTNAGEDRLIAVERFSEAFPIDQVDDSVRLTVRLLLRGLLPTPAA